MHHCWTDKRSRPSVANKGLNTGVVGETYRRGAVDNIRDDEGPPEKGAQQEEEEEAIELRGLAFARAGGGRI